MVPRSNRPRRRAEAQRERTKSSSETNTQQTANSAETKVEETVNSSEANVEPVANCTEKQVESAANGTDLDPNVKPIVNGPETSAEGTNGTEACVDETVNSVEPTGNCVAEPSSPSPAQRCAAVERDTSRTETKDTENDDEALKVEDLCSLSHPDLIDMLTEMVRFGTNVQRRYPSEVWFV